MTMATKSTERPKYKHDCRKCVFLGSFVPDIALSYDLYYCAQHGLPTVLARYGDNGPDYVSGMIASRASPILAEAEERAAQKGLRLTQ